MPRMGEAQIWQPPHEPGWLQLTRLALHQGWHCWFCGIACGAVVGQRRATESRRGRPS